ncbi:MAG: glucose 1-dehydrogenase [Chitinophagaceae bacterium]|jgi:NAD(P)-dependent dehydrogenase (short-subunit alcohol dehydrogenase family)|nr:MAG: glucose 1-dehydrogenase [Chitinophagaceae bacterium]
MFSLQGKNAVITGAGSGIGQAIANTFAENGAEVRILELRKEAAAQTLEQIQAKGGKAAIFTGNVADQKEMQMLMQEVIQQDGKLDILVNCAGIAHVGKLDQTGEEDFDRIYQVNVKGIYNCMYAVIGQMLKQGRGIILNMASVASSVGIADRFAYSMSKGAVLTMTLSVAKDYIDKHIRCNCISPARVHTPFVDGFLAKNYPGKEQEMFDKLSRTQPIGRMAKPSEVAAVALFLCSDEAGFITGCDYPVDGGFIKLNN